MVTCAKWGRGGGGFRGGSRGWVGWVSGVLWPRYHMHVHSGGAAFSSPGCMGSCSMRTAVWPSQSLACSLSCPGMVSLAAGAAAAACRRSADSLRRRRQAAAAGGAAAGAARRATKPSDNCGLKPAAERRRAPCSRCEPQAARVRGAAMVPTSLDQEIPKADSLNVKVLDANANSTSCLQVGFPRGGPAVANSWTLSELNEAR